MELDSVLDLALSGEPEVSLQAYPTKSNPGSG
jgi:hypothetical protein